MPGRRRMPDVPMSYNFRGKGKIMVAIKKYIALAAIAWLLSSCSGSGGRSQDAQTLPVSTLIDELQKRYPNAGANAVINDSCTSYIYNVLSGYVGKPLSILDGLPVVFSGSSKYSPGCGPLSGKYLAVFILPGGSCSLGSSGKPVDISLQIYTRLSSDELSRLVEGRHYIVSGIYKGLANGYEVPRADGMASVTDSIITVSTDAITHDLTVSFGTIIISKAKFKTADN